MVRPSDLSVSSGEDADTIAQQTTNLVDNGRWRLWNNGKGIERTIKFKTFKTTWDFMNAIAAECKKARHHPEWTNVYNRVHVRWTTHSPEGLSGRDVRMAGFCDEQAGEFGEVVEENGGGSAVLGQGVDGKGWREEVMDCCGGKEGGSQ